MVNDLLIVVWYDNILLCYNCGIFCFNCREELGKEVLIEMFMVWVLLFYDDIYVFIIEEDEDVLNVME